jgi:FtsP/CotA-like multicopper oxidase with cupredoxin domain
MLLHLTEFHSYYSANFVIDFNILPQDSGTYDSDSDTLNLSDPPRWDVAVLPSASYLVNAFYTNNPGVWLLHCHIGWHTSEGFALQIVERYSEIAALLALVPLSPLALLESLCFRG